MKNPQTCPHRTGRLLLKIWLFAPMSAAAFAFACGNVDTTHAEGDSTGTSRQGLGTYSAFMTALSPVG